MSKATLPPKDSPTIHLTQPSPAETHAQLLANSGKWRGALSVPAYLRREEVLANQELTRNGGLTSWVLVDKSRQTDATSPSGEVVRPVLSGCESIRKKALVKRKGANDVQEVVAHGVASVFTAEPCRGKGYGGRMINELGEALRTWQSEWRGKREEVLFSVLYSDIGKVGPSCSCLKIIPLDPLQGPRRLLQPHPFASLTTRKQQFYNKHGSWRPHHSTHLTLPPTQSPATTTLPDLPQTKPLKSADLPPLFQSDIAQLRRQLSARPASAPTAVTLLPDAVTFAWHHAREDFVAKEVLGRVPEVKGALALVEGIGGRRAWAMWTRMWYNANVEKRDGNVLYILRLVVETDPDSCAAVDDESDAPGDLEEVRAVAAVLRQAQIQAQEWGMVEVELWSPSRRSRRAAGLLLGQEEGKVKVVEREDESIASLKWFGDEAEGSEVEWLEIEKFGWC